jgi:hypothetical protein
MKVLNDYEDFFNEKHTRNEQNTLQGDYNCGGYALRTFSWYLPYEYDEDDHPYDCNFEWMEDLVYEGHISIEEATEEILWGNVKKMLSDFAGKIRVVQMDDYLEADEELIAFRLSVMRDGKWVEDMDFHYIVLRDGQWKHKLGRDKIDSFDFTEEPWITSYYVYNSSIVYLAHKI